MNFFKESCTQLIMSVLYRHGKELLKRNLGAVIRSQEEVIIAVFVAHL